MPNTYALWGSCRRKQSSGNCCEKNIKDSRLDAMPRTGNEASDNIQLCLNLLEVLLYSPTWDAQRKLSPFLICLMFEKSLAWSRTMT